MNQHDKKLSKPLLYPSPSPLAPPPCKPKITLKVPSAISCSSQITGTVTCSGNPVNRATVKFESTSFSISPISSVMTDRKGEFIADVDVISGYPSTNISIIASTTVNNIPASTFANTVVECLAPPPRNRIYVTHPNNDTVSVIDGSSNVVIAAIGVGDSPYQVAVNPVTNRIYVTHPNNGMVSVIDGLTNALITAIPVNEFPERITVNPVTNRIYVTHREINIISVVDGFTNTVIATLPLASNQLVGITVNPVTNRIYASNFKIGVEQGSVIVIDGSSNAVIETIPVQLSSGIAVNSITNRIYAIRLDGPILVIDGFTNTVISSIRGASEARFEIAVNPFHPFTNRVYVQGRTDDIEIKTIEVIDGTINRVIVKILTDFSSIDGIAVNSITDRIYVIGQGANKVSVIDGITNTVISNIQVGNISGGVAVIP
ncbi:YncE family protein [Bacillus paranthracis]|uniref:YncE family protein n=1 Tax=Bacillus paranthracis TaxID=2026186 RepID=UPI003014EB60